MGLDMYLTKRVYLKDTDKACVNDKEIKNSDYISSEVMYWRKANAIHKWFVDNVCDEDDCKPYYVSKSQLKDLLDLCKTVISKAKLKSGKITTGYKYSGGEKSDITEDGFIIENSDEIAEILPTTSGFFFGSTDYDNYYLDDIKETAQKLEEILKEDEDSYVEYYYQSSW